MANLTVAVVDNAALGLIGIETRDATSGAVVDRQVVLPGTWSEAGQWMPTDISEMPQHIKSVCLDAWTEDVVAANQLAWPWTPPSPPTAADIEREQRLRLAGGFDFDFGDERGVHRIATTEQDMKDWSEVTTWATVMSLAGDTTSTLTIATNTGLAQVTAPDWLAVLAAGTAFRQPIFAGAFWLLAQDPIPPDYATNDAYWGRLSPNLIQHRSSS